MRETRILIEGVALDEVMERLHGAEPNSPSPLRDPEAFVDWIAEPLLGGYAPIARYFLELRNGRHDLLVAYPEVPGRDSGRYVEWIHIYGCAEAGLPPTIFDTYDRLPATNDAVYVQGGINIVGLFDAELGVGEVARRMDSSAAAAALPRSTTVFRGSRSRDRAMHHDSPNRFDTNLLCINADSVPTFYQQAGPRFFQDRYTIGLWFWETSTFPSMFDSAFESVDELWAVSDYVVDVLRRAAPDHVPVLKCPLPIIVPDRSPNLPNGQLGIEGRPYFLVSFDYLSIPDRKNPAGAIDAFCTAFTEDEPQVLLVKSINGSLAPDAAAALQHRTRGRSDVLFWDGYLSAPDNAALLAEAQCYVSLHRSEGYGLNLADALALGTPLVATGASGNLEFCDPEDCYLVDSTPSLVGEGHFPYDADSTWFEPDLDQAAHLLRCVVNDPETTARRSQSAMQRVTEGHSVTRTGDFLRARLAAIRADRADLARRNNQPSIVPPPLPTFSSRIRSLLR